MLPLQVRVDVGAIVMTRYSTFSKAWASLLGFILYIGHSLVGVVLALCRDAVSVFYSPSRLGFRVIAYLLQSELCKANLNFVNDYAERLKALTLTTNDKYALDKIDLPILCFYRDHATEVSATQGGKRLQAGESSPAQDYTVVASLTWV